MRRIGSVIILLLVSYISPELRAQSTRSWSLDVFAGFGRDFNDIKYYNTQLWPGVPTSFDSRSTWTGGA
jgi:hypothetical protein